MGTAAPVRSQHAVRPRAASFAHRCATALGLSAVIVVIFAAAASAGRIVSPGGVYAVQAEASGRMAPFTVVAAGFPPDTRVYVEQCDGLSPDTPQWSPTLDCDLGSSPAGKLTDGNGSVSFPAGDLNYSFRPFRGPSPEGLFNCLGPQQVSPRNGGYDSRNCSVRVSTNNSSATDDQVFFSLSLPNPTGAQANPPPAGGSSNPAGSGNTAASPSSASGSGSAPSGSLASGHTDPSTATASHHGGLLAFTGAHAALLVAIGLECVAVGIALAGRRRRVLRGTR